MTDKNTQIPKDKAEIEALIKSTVDDINEVLAKSGYGDLSKDDGAGQPDDLAAQAAADAGGDPAAAASGDPAAADPAAQAAAADAGGDPAAAASGDPAAEDGGDDMAEMAQHLDEMSVEELSMILEMVQGSIAKKQAADQGGDPAAAAASQDDDLQMSMKSEFASLAKSMGQMAEAVKAVADQNASLATEVANLKKAPAKPAAVTSRPAAANRPQVQVMNKSSEAPKTEALSKSDLENFLMNEMRKSSSQRHPAVNSQVIAELTYQKTPEQVKTFADNLRKQGVALPA